MLTNQCHRRWQAQLYLQLSEKIHDQLPHADQVPNLETRPKAAPQRFCLLIVYLYSFFALQIN
jgi:hypothetical protein